MKYTPALRRPLAPRGDQQIDVAPEGTVHSSLMLAAQPSMENSRMLTTDSLGTETSTDKTPPSWITGVPILTRTIWGDSFSGVNAMRDSPDSAAFAVESAPVESC